jgi:hypothetical protein
MPATVRLRLPRLGLAVARNSAREHGGNLTLAASESGGLRARLELPATKACENDEKMRANLPTPRSQMIAS